MEFERFKILHRMLRKNGMIIFSEIRITNVKYYNSELYQEIYRKEFQITSVMQYKGHS